MEDRMDALLGLLLVLVVFAILIFVVERSVKGIALVTVCIAAVMVLAIMGVVW